MKLPTVKDLGSLVKDVKRYIPTDEDELDLTVGWDPTTGAWDYQTGSNCFAGPAYFYPIWGVVYVTRRCKSVDLARDIREQLADQVEQ